MREAVELQFRSDAPPASPLLQLLAALSGQAQGEAAPVVGVLRTFDQAGTDQRVDRAADSRCTAADRLRDFVEGGGLLCGDRPEQLALRALGSARAGPSLTHGAPRK